MTILIRHLPDASPAGEIARQAIAKADAAQQPCVVLASVRHAFLPPARHALVLMIVRNGRIACEIDARTVVVDDDSYLILNAGYHGAVRIEPTHATRAVECAQLYFPGALIAAVGEHEEFAVHQCLTRHEPLVSPVARYIVRCLSQDRVSPEWLGEQIQYLAHRIALAEQRKRLTVARIERVRADTRQELYRRVTRAADFIDSNYELTFGLNELARIAFLSRFHLLRLFKQVYGVTPQTYKEQKRVLAARRLLEDTDLSRAEVAARVGYSTPTSLRTQLRRWAPSVGPTAAPANAQLSAQQLANT
jgi:AraC family transcriptional regulator